MAALVTSADIHLIAMLMVLLGIYAAIITNVAKIFPHIRPHGKRVFYVLWAVLAPSGFAALFVYCFNDQSMFGK